MRRALAELRPLLNYEKLTEFRLESPPRVAKRDIPAFLDCPNFQKAMRKVEQTMERYDAKVASVAADIDAQDRIIARARADKPLFVDSDSSPERIHRHNECVRIISRATEKRNELVDRHNEAMEDAKEKLGELTQEALLVIDEDIVAALDRCTKIADKLAGSGAAEDRIDAIEICLIEMRIHAAFDDAIDGNQARRDCRERLAEVNRLFSNLCADDEVRRAVTARFQRDAALIQKNRALDEQLTRKLASADQAAISARTEAVTALLAERFDTTFVYEGVVDPARLEAIVASIGTTIVTLEEAVARATAARAATAGDDEAALAIMRDAIEIIDSMRHNVATATDLLSHDHFLCQMLDDKVIESFYQREVRPAVLALRRHVAAAVGEPLVATIIGDNRDRYALTRAAEALASARLERLHQERAKLDGHLRTLSDLIRKCHDDIQKAGEVPRRNADKLRRELRLWFVLTCLPAFGPLFAFGVRGRVKTFEPAFRSSNPVYRELGTHVCAGTRTVAVAALALGALFSVGILVALVESSLSAGRGMTLGVPAAVLLTYGIAGLVLKAAHQRMIVLGYGGAPAAGPRSGIVITNR